MNPLPNDRAIDVDMLAAWQRRTAAARLVGAAASLGVFVAAVRMGVAAKHPIVGIVGGLLASGVAYSVGYNATRLIVGPSAPAPTPNLSGTPDPSTNAGAMN